MFAGAFKDFKDLWQSAPSAVRLGIRLLAVVALFLVVLQVSSAAVTYWAMDQSVSTAARATGPGIAESKKREDLIAAAFANIAKRYPLSVLATGLGAVATIVIALSGGVIALQQFMDSREKDRQDRRDAQAKELSARADDRLDRLAAELKTTLENLASDDGRLKTVAVASLQNFFSLDRSDFHLQALAVLVSAMRSELEPAPSRRDQILLRNMAVTLSRAARAVAPDVRRQFAWSGLELRDIDLAGADLSGQDLREANFENARLAGVNLTGADLTRAFFKGADLTDAILEDAILSSADFAGADLSRARLAGAWIDGAGVLDARLDGAKLEGLRGDWRAIPWDFTRGWRTASFDPPVRKELDDRFGPAATGPHIVMLMWEVPPLVAGGAWTACYHLVRNLRRQGARITVVTPWRRSAVLTAPFGGEVPLIALGIEPPGSETGAYGSSYGAAHGPYGTVPALWSPYGGMQPRWSGYSMASATSQLGSYSQVTSAYGQPSPSGSVLMRLIGEFARVLRTRIADLEPDLIHAHDWVTFAAAEAASEASGAPWLAHVHSTEIERRPDAPDPIIERTETRALRKADHIVTPSEVTRRIVIATAGVPEHAVTAVPNTLSAETIAASAMGRFEDRKVVFLGRLTRQKGLDRFAQVAARVAPTVFASRFEVIGDGEARGEVEGRYPLSFRGPVGWNARSDAFAGAAVLLAPSRAEPFGMVVLEAMQHRVPVVYPNTSGAAEALASGVKVDAGDVDAMTAAVTRLLTDWAYWEETVEAQAEECAAYPERDYPERIAGIWDQMIRAADAATLAEDGSALSN